MQRFSRFLLLIQAPFLFVACTGGAETQLTAVSPPPPPAAVTVSLSGGDSINEGTLGGTITFQVNLSEAASANVDVDYETRADTATENSDFLPKSESLSIPAGQTSASIDIVIIDDSIDEPDETFFVDITAVTGGAIGVASASGLIVDEDPPSTIGIADASVSEGDNGPTTLDFPVMLSEESGFDIRVDFATANETATAGIDYVDIQGQATIPSGSMSTTISADIIGDTVNEGDETFSITLSNAANAAIGTSIARGTIIDDDIGAPPDVTVSIGSAGSVNEGAVGATLTFPILLSVVSPADIDVQYQTRDGTAQAGNDYVAQATTVTIPSGSMSASVDISIVDDLVDEFNESLNVDLISVSSGSIATGSASGTITDNDPRPTISIGDASIAEGDAGQQNLSFTLSLSGISGKTVNTDFSSNDGTATSGSDYQAVNGNTTIAIGDLTTTINVPILGDTVNESDETFTVTLSNASRATIADGTATGTIMDDDGVPNLSIADASLSEGDAGQSDMTFTVTLSAQSGSDVTVDYASSDGTATAGSDYQAVNGNATITAGNLTTTISVPILGDTTNEPDETFTLTLSNASSAAISDGTATGTISDDDGAPSLSIADASLNEGDAGQSNMTFTVTLSGQSGSDVTMDYASSDGTATAGSDYQAVNGNASITAGNLTTTIDVPIFGDVAEEADETFTITLGNSVNAGIADGTAVGTIVEDDPDAMSGLPSRPSNGTCLAPDRPSTNTSIDIVDAFPNLPGLSSPVGLLQAPADSTSWYGIEKDGRVRRFNNNPNVSGFSTFIDIRSPNDPIDVDSGENEAGLLGMAFHPKYGVDNWYVYLSYTIDGAGTSGPLLSVISRFESKDNGATLDATDALELITLVQPRTNHNGGQITFGPDGYLYISFGDGGGAGDPPDNAQNTNNLFGSMLRIDVDSGTPYGIPGDNPNFGNALCNDGDGNAACPEIYAWGLRNPWKWSFDDVTGQLWLGDVGQNAWEEVNIVDLGGNYGWRCREGSNDFNTSGNCPGGLIDPVIEYSHDIGNSITGGYVYRGSAIPELAGRYVFGDYARGKVFASVDDGNGGYSFEELLDNPGSISAFAVESNGELLYLSYGSGKIRRIVQGSGNSNNTIPDQLSETGCVQVADPTQPASGLIPYDNNAPFWSDGAAKERWYAIPDGTTIDVGADGDWQFPNGTVLTKNFSLNGELIETRLFMRHPDGVWAGYTYEWNAAGTDADRVVGGKVKNIGGQDWIYPSGAECLECHTMAAGFSLGVEHGQLNREFTYPSTGITANQLVTADFVELLTAPLGDEPTNLPKFADPTDTNATLADRARAYLHSNCAGCHRPGGPAPSDMDLRHDTPLQNTNTCNVVPESGDLGIANARIIDPGNAATSVLVERVNRRDVNGMPPLGSTVVDAVGAQLLSDWINSLASCP